MGTRLKLLRRWIAQRMPGAKTPPPPIVPRPEIFAKVREILVNSLTTVHRDEITPETRLMEDLGVDSMDAIEIVMAIEEEFGIEIPDEDAEKLKTMPELLQYLERRLRDDGKRSDRG